MSPSRRFFSISILISLIHSSVGLITCHSCEGINCKKGTCEGDYCVSSYYNPKWGGQSLLKAKTLVKGCMNGTILANNIESHCIYNTDSKSNEMCICDSDLCTSKNKKFRKVKSGKITCKCSGGKGCDEGECTGDLCTWTKSINQKSKPIMGCMDYSIPVLERRAIDSCMLPPMVGSMHFHAMKDHNKLLTTESCICSTDMCNENKPFELSEKKEKVIDTQKCESYVKGSFKEKDNVEVKSECFGEFCYRMRINATELGQLGSYDAAGCATYKPGRKMDPLFGTRGKIGQECADFSGDNLNMRLCYKTKDGQAMKRLKESIVEEESDAMKEDYEEGEEEEGEGEVTIDVKENEKGKNGKANGKKEEEEEEEEDENGEEKGEKEEEEKERGDEMKKEDNENNINGVVDGGKIETPTTKLFVFVAPTDAPTPDESNATMITVFVLIILCICVAGITWKFQLHRKLMRGNYDTVAGG